VRARSGEESLEYAEVLQRLAAGSGDLAGSIRQIQELRRTWLEAKIDPRP
jgi:hypothetical protein